jgi:hypothetical protein
MWIISITCEDAVAGDRPGSAQRDLLGAMTIERWAPSIADVVVRRSRAFGILVARGALTTSSLWDGESLLDWIEGARDDLELPPGDPAQRVFEALGGKRKAKAEVKLAEADAHSSTRPQPTAGASR